MAHLVDQANRSADAAVSRVIEAYNKERDIAAALSVAREATVWDDVVAPIDEAAVATHVLSAAKTADKVVNTLYECFAVSRGCAIVDDDDALGFGRTLRRVLMLAIAKGAPVYNAGNIRGCYHLYKEVAESVLERCQEGVMHETVNKVLSQALKEAAELETKSPELMPSAWKMRESFDELIDSGIDCKLTEFVPEPEVAQPADTVLTCLERAIDVGAPTYNEGNHQGCYVVYKHTAEQITSRLGDIDEAVPKFICETLSTAVKECAQNKNNTERAWTMRHALDHILETGRDRILAGDPMPTTAELFAMVRMSDKAPTTVKAGISAAIRTGAPSFNSGDIEGCCRIYVNTAQEIIEHCSDEETKDALLQALDKGRSQGVRARAWTLRDAFDMLRQRREDPVLDEPLPSAVELLARPDQLFEVVLVKSASR